MKGISLQLEADGKYDSSGARFSVHETELEPTYIDDISGATLDSNLVRQARAEELRHFAEHGVCDVVPVGECWKTPGKGPIGS